MLKEVPVTAPDPSSRPPPVLPLLHPREQSAQPRALPLGLGLGDALHQRIGTGRLQRLLGRPGDVRLDADVFPVGPGDGPDGAAGGKEGVEACLTTGTFDALLRIACCDQDALVALTETQRARGRMLSGRWPAALPG
ncbi:hypothetical protein [Pelomonas sp. BJYL3]|uniref:hypothetical protein n=1 Tax=Pelomonas sp. BJYL3 TaxID=2976697 RepID=UPI0022B56FD3|nr:hypothetical protein [Pelomonas sp. BJYL3]